MLIQRENGTLQRTIEFLDTRFLFSVVVLKSSTEFFFTQGTAQRDVRHCSSVAGLKKGIPLIIYGSLRKSNAGTFILETFRGTIHFCQGG